jgi:hypothetical protein
MAGWRDQVSDDAQSDLDKLTDAAVEFALRQLGATGAFLPFTLAVSTGGDTEVVQPNYVRGAELDAAGQLATQWASIEQVKGDLRAVAVAVDVRLAESGKDAIDIVVEHRDGVAIGILFPYVRSGDGDYDVESPSAYSADRKVWV